MFKTDGSVHHEGVQNEKDTIKILNKLKIYENKVERRGGTKQKADAVSGSKQIGIKRKKGIQNGSFDWFNTSQYNSVLGDIFQSFLENVKEFRFLPKSILEDDTFVNQVRDKFNVLCETCLNNLTSEDVATIIQQGMKDTLSGFDIVVNDCETKSLFIFPFENHLVNQYLNSNYTITLQGKGKSSRKVIFSDGIHTYDCGLRIRITSNNGINAFLGMSKSNKNSQVVIKLQQDNIKELLSVTKPQTYDYQHS
jgi:hypothetical protein